MVLLIFELKFKLLSEKFWKVFLCTNYNKEISSRSKWRDLMDLVNLWIKLIQRDLSTRLEMGECCICFWAKVQIKIIIWEIFKNFFYRQIQTEKSPSQPKWRNLMDLVNLWIKLIKEISRLGSRWVIIAFILC